MIVVTGAAGFIGSNLVRALNDRGRTDIVVCDAFGSDEKWRNLATSLFRAVVPPDALVGWLRGRDDVDAVIHMGAISATTARDADAVIATNITLSVALLDLCTTQRIPFVYASSAATYGAGEQGFTDRFDPDAIAALRPLNLYGWSKRHFDWVMADRHARGQPMPPACAGIRYFNVYGPNEYHKGDMRSIVAKIIAPIRAGEPVRLFKSHRDGIADGDQRRDFVYVKDAVRATLALLDAGATGIFNVGTGEAHSFREVTEAVFAGLGLPPHIEYIDMPDAIRDTYQYYTAADLANLRRHYTAAFTPMRSAVSEYVANYLADGRYL